MKVKLLESIYDDGEDHHPPGILAKHGEILLVIEKYDNELIVKHVDSESKSGFRIYPGEYEIVH